MSFEDMSNADQGSNFEEMERQLRINHRITFGNWDGNPRRCSKCNQYIETTRLQLINAQDCKKCAFGLIDDSDEELYEI